MIRREFSPMHGITGATSRESGNGATMIFRVFAGIGMLLSLGVCAGAQSYPDKPVRVIVPFAAGGSPDIVARIISQQLTNQTGKAFIVDNRAGADGMIGTQVVAESAPDGYTLLVTSSSFVVNPSFHRTLPFDVNKSFEAVTNICAVDGFILAVNPKLPAQSVPELVALAKRPDGISFASPGVGNVLHLAGELFQQRIGAKLLHVPYKGGAPVMTGLIGGEVDMAFLLPHTSVSYIESGTIRALGYTGAKRAAFLPKVPTLNEAGVKDMESMGTWAGMFAPAKTPVAIQEMLQAEVAKALAVPSVRERLVELGYIPVGNSPAAFKAYIADQVERIHNIVETAGIKPN
jgi:tripartite-type tricarboxylate transporter receptor subunit TctC